MHVGHLLPSSCSIVHQDEEILGVKHGTQAALCLGHTVHQGPALLGPEVGQSGHASFGNDEGVPRSSWKDVKEGVPAFATGHRMGRKFALDDAFEQRRFAHGCAWRDAVLNPHADSAGARTQWPETPLRTARVSMVPSDETRVWCI